MVNAGPVARTVATCSPYSYAPKIHGQREGESDALVALGPRYIAAFESSRVIADSAMSSRLLTVAANGLQSKLYSYSTRICSKHHICRPMSLSSRVGRVFSEASESLFGGSDFASEFGRGSEFVSISEPVQCTFDVRF